MSYGLHRIEFLDPLEGMRVRRTWAAARIGDPLGVDPAREVAAQRLAAAAELAPRVLAFDPIGRAMEMAFVPGQALEPDWPMRPARRAAMADLLAHLRRLSPVGLPTLDLRDRVQSLHRELSRRAPAQAAAWEIPVATILREAESAGIFDAAYSGACCLVHGDLTPENTRVRTDGSLVLVDWEYAHAGHPLEDLAGLLVEDATADALTAAASIAGEFVGVRDPSLVVRVRLRRLLDVLWKAVAATFAGVGESR